jgi:hypothetical protein
VFCFFGLGLLASLVGAADALAQARANVARAEVEVAARARHTRAAAKAEEEEAQRLRAHKSTFYGPGEGSDGRRSASMPRERPPLWARVQETLPPPPQPRHGERHGSRGSAPAALSPPPPLAWQPLPPTTLLAGGVGAQPFLSRGRDTRERESMVALWERRAAEAADAAAEAAAAAATAARRGGGGARRQRLAGRRGGDIERGEYR